MTARRLSPAAEAQLTPFARALREAIEKSGKTQMALAEHLGLVPGAIGNACTSRRPGALLTEENTREAARFLGADTAGFLRARAESQRMFKLRNTSPAHAALGAALAKAWAHLSPEQAETLTSAVRAMLSRRDTDPGVRLARVLDAVAESVVTASDDELAEDAAIEGRDLEADAERARQVLLAAVEKEARS